MGLKAQYLVYFFLGMLAVFFAFALLYLLGLNLYGCVFFALAAASLLTGLIFRWNRVYGQFGLMKRAAQARRPDYLVNQGKYLKRLRYKTKSDHAGGI